MTDSYNSQNILRWMASERLYEEYLFFYIIILVFWAAVGFFSFGFEIEGYSQPENLFLNFLLFIFLAIMMVFTPFWYRLIFGTEARLQRRTQEVYEQVEKIQDEEKRKAILRYLERDGALPPRKLQKWCLIILGWCVIFELFFISAWIKDLHLVWQPEWANTAITWIRSNTVDLISGGNNIGTGIFLVDIKDSGFLSLIFSSGQDFLYSDIGNTVLLFHFFHAVMFWIVLFSLIILLWKPIDWLGFDNLNPNKINGKRRFFFCIIVSIISMIAFCLGGFGILFQDVSYHLRINPLLKKEYYLSSFWINIIFIFTIFGLKFFSAWFWFFVGIFRGDKK